MALPVNHPMNERVVTIYHTDTSSAASAYGGAPCKGYITKLMAVLGPQAIGTANNVLTAFINGNAVTHDTWTQLTASSAAGDVATANVSSNNYVQDGDTIKITSDGGGSNTCPSHIYVTIQVE